MGELVLAFNEEIGEVGYYPVTATWAHLDPVVVELTIDSEVVWTTPEHPFYTVDGGWETVLELQVGEEIRQADGSTGVVEGVVYHARPQMMYNMTVATAHTYFVGDGHWLVHNSCPNLPKWVRGDRTRGVLDTGGEFISVFSGKSGGPALAFADDLSAFDPMFASTVHAESHAAAAMRQLGVSEATLYINNLPCAGVFSCQQFLPSRLAEGSTLHIYVGSGDNYKYFGSFTGIPD